MRCCIAKQYIVFTDVIVIWAGGRTTPPADQPPCGWVNEHCSERAEEGDNKLLGTIFFFVHFKCWNIERQAGREAGREGGRELRKEHVGEKEERKS